MEKPAARVLPIRTSCLALALLLLASVLLAQSAPPAPLPARTYIIAAYVEDAAGKPVPDALVLVRLSPRNGTPASNSTQLLEVPTNLAGRARILLPVGLNQSTPDAYISAYTPYWSSSPSDLNLPDRPTDIFDRSFSVPIELNTYRVRISDRIGNPVPLADVQFTQPYPLYRRTDPNGLAQVRFPPGLPVSGYVQYQGAGQFFTLDNASSATAIEQDFNLPLARRINAWNQSFDWSAQLSDAMGRPLLTQPIALVSDYQNWTYLTDRDGRLYLRALPGENITLEWTGYNFTYRFPLNISRASTRLQMPLLINISDPAKDNLGDSCYRILINVTDRRKSPYLQVQARPINGSGALPFTLDKSVPLANQTGVQFTRILCVDTDTAFDIIAQNPYEQAQLQIQLKTAENFVPSVSSAYTQPPPPSLFVKSAARSTGDKIEIILILIYILFGLIALFMAMRFKQLLLYYAQSILRFTYISYTARQASAPPKEDYKAKTSPPPAPPKK
ncbi:Uncharacterised protein [uncultured archaeon]|nr:Uncharacterised protein [uncultured archaeon]